MDNPEMLGERGLLIMDLGDSLYRLCNAENFRIWTLTDLNSPLNFTDIMAGRFILSPTAGPYCAQPSARLIQKLSGIN